MKTGSQYSILQKPPDIEQSGDLMKTTKPKKQPKNVVDTNILEISYENCLNAKTSVAMRDNPIKCKKCGVCLHCYSKIFTAEEYKKFVDSCMEEQKSEELSTVLVPQKPEAIYKARLTQPLTPTDSIWICEFCYNHNLIHVKSSLLPTSPEQFYLIEEAKSEQDPCITFILCIDASGSMKDKVSGMDSNPQRAYRLLTCT
jgi:hypothetical protein